MTWHAGQNSALYSGQISSGSDIGNVVAQRRGSNGNLEEYPSRVDFAFAYHAFFPDSKIHVQLSRLRHSRPHAHSTGRAEQAGLATSGFGVRLTRSLPLRLRLACVLEAKRPSRARAISIRSTRLGSGRPRACE